MPSGDAPSQPGFEWLSKENVPVLQPEQIAYVGLRDVDFGERLMHVPQGFHFPVGCIILPLVCCHRKLLSQHGILSFTMHEVDRYGIGEVMEVVKKHLEGRPLHLSYDIDAVDPLHAPATGTVVRGGLNYREALYVAEAAADTGRLGSLDMVEVNPTLSDADGAELTAELANLVTAAAMGSRII